MLKTTLGLGGSALREWFRSRVTCFIGPLELIRCADCSLVQLAHSFPAEMTFGGKYGYRSGLNGLMVEHLQSKV